MRYMFITRTYVKIIFSKFSSQNVNLMRKYGVFVASYYTYTASTFDLVLLCIQMRLQNFEKNYAHCVCYVECSTCSDYALHHCFSASKGFWAEMLGVGDFYYELGVQIIEVCLATSHRNGGMCM